MLVSTVVVKALMHSHSDFLNSKQPIVGWSTCTFISSLFKKIIKYQIPTLSSSHLLYLMMFAPSLFDVDENCPCVCFLCIHPLGLRTWPTFLRFWLFVQTLFLEKYSPFQVTNKWIFRVEFRVILQSMRHSETSGWKLETVQLPSRIEQWVASFPSWQQPFSHHL